MMTVAVQRTSKILYIVRHGQALHNPRAEVAKAAGCSMEEFFELMKQDDVLDADLTELGRDQARKCHERHFCAQTTTITAPSHDAKVVNLVVSSPLSRALETADLVYPALLSSPHIPKVCIEDFREVNGSLLNGQRRTKTFLSDRFPTWNFDLLTTDQDELWTVEMEAFEAAAERGYRGLAWLLSERDEDRILLVSHGGILRYLMNDHPSVHLVDARSVASRANGKSVESRFDNCEVRKYQLSWKEDDGNFETEADENGPEAISLRRSIILTQIDHE